MHGNAAKAQWRFSAANFGWIPGLEKIGRAGANDLGGTVRLEEHGGIFFDRDRADLHGPAVLQNARKENDKAAHAIALGEVRVRHGAAQKRDAQKIAGDGDFVAVRICQCFR